MGEYWFRRHPFVYNLFNKADMAIQDILPHGLKPYMLYNSFATDEESARVSGGLLRDTRIAQPAIVLSSIATSKSSTILVSDQTP
jgi:malonyl CoA-acyl carrier protein transacylase